MATHIPSTKLSVECKCNNLSMMDVERERESTNQASPTTCVVVLTNWFRGGEMNDFVCEEYFLECTGLPAPTLMCPGRIYVC